MLIFLALSLPRYGWSQSFSLSPEYLGLIQQKVTPHFVYPKEAKLKGWEGVVKVKFTLAQDGRIKEMDVAESSGYPLLDAAAMLAIKDASPYPFPKNYPKEETEITLPLTYKQPSPAPAPQLLEKLPLPPATKLDLPPASELSNFMDLALKNNEPLKVTADEIKLSQMKIVEAERGLFPGLKLSGYTTTGETSTLDFEEREAKVQVDQPLFTGGRLIDTVRQAKINLEISQKAYERIKLDAMHKTETAYYNLITAKMHLSRQEELLLEAREMLRKIEKLSRMGLVIPLEATSARSWLEQLELQKDTVIQEVLMAELNFKQALNVTELPEIENRDIEIKKINLSLDECLELAYQNQPELHLSQLLMQFNDYGQKIENAKNKAFNVDLTASYGRYKGHFKSEPWNEQDNWFGGVKVTKPWGPSTFNSNYNQEKIQPRFGVSTPNKSKTLTGEFNLLDNMKRLTDKKKADVDLARSLSDFNETFKAVTFQAQEAFMNYQKAILQLNAAQIEIKFRRNETEVVKMRSLAGETSLSNTLEALFNLSQANTKYYQALANYQGALANLKKATGYSL